MNDLEVPERTLILAETVIRRAPQGAPTRSEHEEQVALFRWAHANAHKYGGALSLLYASMNGGVRYAHEAVKLKQAGSARGVPDIHLPVARKGFHGLWIELKRVKGATVAQEQKEWIMRLTDEGHLAVVCYGAEAAQQVIQEYLE